MAPIEPLLSTKLYIPQPRSDLVPRLRLTERLEAGTRGKLTLVSAPAGYGKSTLVSEWIAHSKVPTTWLSLDASDNDLAQFFSYLIAALQQINPDIGVDIQSILEAGADPPIEYLLTTLVNDITASATRFILVLDDYHLIQEIKIHQALDFLFDHFPPGMHMVIISRTIPAMPLGRLRVQRELSDIREVDLRFSFGETTSFLNDLMGLALSPEDIQILEARTEGWIAGLQLAAISLQGKEDTTKLIKSFSGSHRLVLDYLIEEVLNQQPESVQTFLLQTAILNRLTSSLCNALTGQEDGQQILEYLEQANLFIVPLDNERRWYRYHHLFADLLRQRLHQRTSGDEGGGVDEYHIRASVWYEDNGLEIEAFHHAAAANDLERAERLIEGEGMPLQLRGAAAPVLNWLASLPTTVLDARPSLWVAYASALVFAGQAAGAEEKLKAAETALQGAEPDDKTQDLVGNIAALRALIAISQYHVETIIAQSRRALEFLHPDNLPLRTSATWTLGFAYQLQGDRAAASRAYTEVISNSQASGNIMVTLAATTSLGMIQEAENQLYLAAETYRRALQLAGDHPFTCASYLGLARVCYEWNDLEAAQQHGQQSAQLAPQIEGVDLPAACGVLLARLKLAQGDVAGAAKILTTADQFVRQHNFMHQMPEVAAAQVITLLHQGDLAAAAHLAEKHELPISQARVHLAQGETSAALAVLGPLRQQVEAKSLEDELLKVMVLQAVALHAHSEKEQAVQLLGDALALAELGGFIRIFVDEGPPMARLLYEVLSRGISPDYVQRLLAAFPDAEPEKTDLSKSQIPESEWVEPLNERELEVLQLIAVGLSNQEIANQLYLSVNTVKWYARNIYSKLGVGNRRAAVIRARELGILQISKVARAGRKN